ncbi:cobalt dependent X-Pro dipeptidase [Geomicrobium sp. JCM 19037]|uniref:M24 family metallopeptidase n=1 Tax=Geomicrobium sp. JCM 19037 TaxID=1460634 RepID=UPI00045F3362|nr:Xaa-Pro peptidase family protein [Geomicrobium sp. JCM 19037]GAK02978.1 cobalt dependent X-Pro dipeptidase [Geomicrobium sp. JCM 19037]
MEKHHAETYALVDHVHDYPEYPGLKHPMEHFKDYLHSIGMTQLTIGIDGDGYSSPKGYRGPKLSELLDNHYTSVYGLVEELRSVKSKNEVELIKESCRWANLAHSLLVKYSNAGKTEVEIETQATAEATLAMIETLGKGYLPNGSPAHAFYRGQIGPHSAFPHSQNQNLVLKRGYNVISQAAAHVWGYISELERTMFVEEVSKEQERYFNHMKTAQEIAFDAIKPGVKASAVDIAVQNYFKEEGISHLSLHHTGHALGLVHTHEAPFFDTGDATVLEAGMVFSVEPGLFVQGLGGFRHSDTILITDEGMDMLTYYPRDLESLIIT